MINKNLETLKERADAQESIDGFTIGEQCLYLNYNEGLRVETDKLTIKDMPWVVEDIKSLSEALDNYEVTEFVLTDNKVDMRTLATLDKLGWKMNGMTKVKYFDYYYGEYKWLNCDGIHFIK